MKHSLLLPLVALALAACDPVCDIATFHLSPEDGRTGVPCSVELQHAEAPVTAPHRHTVTHTGEDFTVHTFRPSGRCRVAIDCEGYALATTRDFDCALKHMGCRECVHLGEVRVGPSVPTGSAH